MTLLSRFAAAISIAAAAVSVAFAQSPSTSSEPAYPIRPIHIINPFAAGGPSDILARIVAEQLNARLGQPVIVETKAGAGGNIGMEAVARSAPDGYTLVSAATGTLVINQHVFPHMGYDPFKDFLPISLMASIDNVLVVRPGVPASNLKEFLAYAKDNPGKVTYGSPGIGNQPHLAGEMFRMATGTQIRHIPYKGASEATTALLGGQIDMLFGQVTAVAPYIRAGKLKAIGIASLKRSPQLPDVPTLDEQGLTRFESASIYALMAPKGTPKPIVDKLAKEVRATLQDSATEKKAMNLGMHVIASTPEQLAEVMRQESARYAEIVKAANIKVE